MKNERENIRSVKLSASKNGIPKVSFKPAAGVNDEMVSEEYNIADNEVTAFYDSAHRLIFVLDATVDDRKPNVLLVINPDKDRKWDDILANDFDVDLETIRPKKDNKYQKLDIEYSGLSIYNRLINDFNAGEDLTEVLAELSNFRNSTAHRVAADRLTAATDTIVTARDTISKTTESLDELQDKYQRLREKLSKQKKEVGREPTKQSAAKILKTESQLDATVEKLRRARKRLNRAQSRLATAEEDAEIARQILAIKNPMQQPMVKIIERVIEPEVTAEPEEIEEEIQEEVEEEVKPLFSKDPEILDDSIAFKPIDFGAPQEDEEFEVEEELVADEPEEEFELQEEYDEPDPVEDPMPLSFVPPVVNTPAPMFEPVPVPEVMIEETPVLEPVTIIESEPEPVPEPIMSAQPVPVPDVRPVSPITGTVPLSSDTVVKQNRPTMMYYIMLVILIVLSIFTLWLYQKKTIDTTPDVTAVAQPEIIQEVVEPVMPIPDIIESPFIEPEIVVEPEYVPEPEPEVIIEPEPEIVVEPEYVPEPEPEIIIEPEPVAIIPEPVYYAEPVAPVVKPEPVVNKPVYDVSSDRMFIADPEFESDNEVYDEPIYMYEPPQRPQPQPQQQQGYGYERTGGYYYDDGPQQPQYQQQGYGYESDNYESYERYSSEYYDEYR